MDNKKIKKFAIYAKKEFIKNIKSHANDLIKKYEDNSYNDQIINLNKQIKNYGFEKTIEDISYIWYIRFITIYFMEINQLFPKELNNIYILRKNNNEINITQKSFKFKKNNHLSISNIVLEKKSKKEIFKNNFISICNYLYFYFPFLYEKTNDYTELLFPEILIENSSVISNMSNMIDEKDWKKFEIIGWLYQYYISDEKKQIFNDIKKNIKVSKEKVSTATQLFTPKWIVKYMIENTLGSIIYKSNKDINKLHYKINKDVSDNNKEFDLENISIMDPAVGTGHILLYAFDLLYDFYRRNNYSPKKAVYSIIEKNLYGLDIDDKAVNITKFLLYMKAINKFTGFYDKKPVVRIFYFPNIVENDLMEKENLINIFSDKKYDKYIDILHKIIKDGNNFGSLIKIDKLNYSFLLEEINNKIINIERNLFYNQRVNALKKIKKIIEIIILLSDKYDVVVTNPPYMGKKNLNIKLRDFLNSEYEIAKSDLFSAFIIRNFELTKENGYLGFMSPFVWMFNSRYKDLRKKIVNEKTILSLIQLEYSSFYDAIVPICTYIFRNKITNEKGSFIKLSNFKGYKIQEEKALEAINNKNNVDYYFEAYTKEFRDIPDYLICYWISDKIKNIFHKEKPLKNFANPRQGLATGNNEEFLRFWYEVNIEDIGFNFSNTESFHSSNFKYAPYKKGGSFRKWYGNHELVIKFDSENYNKLSKQGNNLPSKKYYFKESITWGTLTVGTFNSRYSPEGFVFDTKGSSCFFENKKILYYVLGYLNSKITQYLLDIISPSVDFNAGSIAKLPFKIIEDDRKIDFIDLLVKENIEICKQDWDFRETSWDFKFHPFLKDKNRLIEDNYKEWKNYKEKQFNKLFYNEGLINKEFLQIFNIQDEIDFKPSIKDITVKKSNLKEDVKSFISYSIGCIFGRYSPEKKGIINANKEFDLSIYNSFNYKPVTENIIPINNFDYFKKNIYTLFLDFLKNTFGENNFEKNIDFIQKSLDNKKNNGEQVLKKYFEKEFYKEHIKTFNKRPIYWLFSSKHNNFQVLVYYFRFDTNTLINLKDNYLKKLIDNTEFKLNEIKKSKKNNKNMIKFNNYLGLINELNEYEREINKYINKKIKIKFELGIKNNQKIYENLIKKSNT